MAIVSFGHQAPCGCGMSHNGDVNARVRHLEVIEHARDAACRMEDDIQQLRHVYWFLSFENSD